MRVADRPIPVTAPGPRPPARWPAELFVGLERLPYAAYTWDDDDARVGWDADGYLWDDPLAVVTSILDATCDVRGVEVDFPRPDGQGRFTAASAAITLDNATGRWSQYDATGRLVYFAPGRDVHVWARYGGADWWLFSGEVATWTELPDGSVDIEAVDAFSNLNQGIGEWTPGSYGQRPGARIAAILTLVNYPGASRLDTGDVTLHAWLTTATPLEELQAVAISDGGVVAVDADGTLLYRDRTWPNGRADQTAIPVLSDNVCDGTHQIWDLELATDDQLANVVQLANVEGVTVTGQSPDSVARYRRRTLEHTHDQWTTAAEADALATFLLSRQADAPVRVESFTLYLHDPQQNLWPVGVDLRRGDLIRLPREQVTVSGVELIDVNLVVWAVRHQITPDGWLVEVGTTRAVSANQWWRWDDPAPITWDDPTDPPQWTF